MMAAHYLASIGQEQLAPDHEYHGRGDTVIYLGWDGPTSDTAEALPFRNEVAAWVAISRFYAAALAHGVAQLGDFERHTWAPRVLRRG